jgi:peptide/nickel transport system permease protein
MRGSIPASATPDGGFPAVEPRLLSRRAILARRFFRTPAAVVGLVLTLGVVVAGLLAGAIAPGDPFTPAGRPLVAPSWAHLMGSDDLGRDLLGGVVHGARTSMLVVLAVLVIAAPIGVAVGGVSGFRGGVVDDVLMRVTELFQAMPRFFLAIVAVALFGAGLDNLILVLGLTSWPLLARVVRAETLSVREREFVEAARALGASEVRVLVRHVLPNVLPPALVVISLTGASVILLEASVGFLGLGDPDVMSWGYLANNSQRFLRTAWWMSVFPGAAIAVAVLGLNLLSDGLNDALNPFDHEPRAASAIWGVAGRRRTKASSS